MAITFEIDKMSRRIRTTVTDAITVKDILGHFESTHLKDALGYAELIDARRAGQPYLLPADIWHAAVSVRTFKPALPLGPRAVVVDNEVTYALACMLAMCVLGLCSMKVFCNLLAAEDWLGWRIIPDGS